MADAGRVDGKTLLKAPLGEVEPGCRGETVSPVTSRSDLNEKLARISKPFDCLATFAAAAAAELFEPGESMRLLPASVLWTSLLLSAAPPVFAAGAAGRSVDAVDAVDAVVVEESSNGARLLLRSSSFAAQKPHFSLLRLANPARVVIDIPDVDVSSLSTPSPSTNVLAVTTTQLRGRAGSVGRVVFVLARESEVEAAVEGDAIVVRTTVLAGTQAAISGAQAAPGVRAEKAVQAEKSDSPVITLAGDAAGVSARHLQDIVAEESSGRTIVKIITDGEVARYEVDEVTSPARLVVDLDGIAANGIVERSLRGAWKAARVGRHGDKTRVVFESRNDALPHYEIASTGDGLAIVVSPADGKQDKAAELRGVTLEPKSGFWRLRLELGKTVSLRTVKNAAGEKVIALDGARVPPALLGRRGLVGGPVGDVVVEQDAHRTDSVRVSLRLQGDVDDSAWQRDGVVYWDVRRAGENNVGERVQPSAAPWTSGPATLTQQTATSATFKGKKVTIDMQDAEIVNVIRLIGDFSGKNVVVGEDVKGKVTVKLKNVPWDQALDVVLKTKDLGQETRGGVIRIVPQAKLDLEREARLKLQEQRDEKLPTTVRLIPVNYAVATELVPQVKELLSKRGKVTSDTRTNVIIVEDIRDNLDQAERLVRTLDTQTPQVLIEARMVEGATSFTRALGIQWGGGLFFSQRGGNPTGLVFPNNVGIAGGADTGAQQAVPGVFFPSNFAVNLPAQNVNSGVGVNLGSIGNFGFLNARLTAAESTGQAKIISSPRVTTLNNKRARISQGTQITVPLVTLNQLTVQTVQAALELDVTPHVTADGSILMQIRLTNNVPDFSQQVGVGVPPVSTKEAETEMLVKDGDTAVIGGIYTRNTAENFAETPFLSSIPLLGWLFKNSSESDTRTELLVFITPRIVNRRSATLQGGGL
jgi:type IV pilus assembly protein PilQ